MKTYDTSRSYRYAVLALCWLAGTFAGMDANLFSVLLQPMLAEIGSVEQASNLRLASHAIASFLLGWMAGGIAMGLASDRYGRAKMLALSIFLYACSTGLVATVDHVATLTLFRFMTGLGVGGTMVGIAIFLSETWGSSSRAIALSLLITSYQAGVLLSGVAAQLLPNWRHAFLAGSIPAVLTIAVLAYFQEPPVQNRLTDQKPILKTPKNLLLGAVMFGSLLIGYWASLTWIPTWLQELLGNTASGNEKNIATMLHGLCAIAGCILAGPLSDRWGRKQVILISYTGAMMTSLWMFLGHQTFTPLLFVYFSGLGFFIGMAQAVMYIYLPELFPRERRATYVGICLNGGRLVTVLAVLFMGAMLHWFGGYREALSVFSAIYAVGICCTFLAPETRLNVASHGVWDI